MQYEQKNLYATSATQGLTRTRWSVFIPDSRRENTALSLQFPSRSLALSRLTNQQRTILRLQIFFFSNVFFRMVASMGICFCTHCGPHLRSAWVCIDSETVTRCSWESLHLSDMSSALHLITLYSNKQISFSYWHIQIQNWINTKCKDTQSNPKENTLIRLC